MAAKPKQARAAEARKRPSGRISTRERNAHRRERAPRERRHEPSPEIALDGRW